MKIGEKKQQMERRGHNNQRRQESSGGDFIGSYVHDNDKDHDDETESETMKHAMATVKSTGMEHQNAYESIRAFRN